MSSTEVYYYQHKSQTAHKEPRKYQIPNANAFCDYVHKIFGVDLSISTNMEGNKVQRAYNQFIESNHPEWKKIVATFASAGTLIFDEDRQKVENVLYLAEDELELPYSQLSGLALLLEALPSGLVAVQGHSVLGCCLGYSCEDDSWVWFSQKELKERFLRAAIPTKWTYVGRD